MTARSLSVANGLSGCTQLAQHNGKPRNERESEPDPALASSTWWGWLALISEVVTAALADSVNSCSTMTSGAPAGGEPAL